MTTWRTGKLFRVVGVAMILLLLTTGIALAQANGEIDRVWVDHNVTEDGEYGMRIHVEFTARNMRNSQGRLAAYFSFQDGAALEDFNDRFTTTGGNVSVGENFSPSYAQSRYDDFKLFIPYDELHMSDGEHQLEFKVIAFHTLGDGYTEYARSSGHRFTYDSAPDHENGEGEFGVDRLEAGFTPDPHTVSLREKGACRPLAIAPATLPPRPTTRSTGAGTRTSCVLTWIALVRIRSW